MSGSQRKSKHPPIIWPTSGQKRGREEESNKANNTRTQGNNATTKTVVLSEPAQASQAPPSQRSRVSRQQPVNPPQGNPSQVNPRVKNPRVKNEATLSMQREDRKKILDRYLLNKWIVGTVKKEIPRYRFLNAGKRKICSYDPKILPIAEQFLRDIIENPSSKSKEKMAIDAYECLGFVSIICALDRIYDTWTYQATSGHHQPVNGGAFTHQHAILRAVIVALEVFYMMRKEYPGSRQYNELYHLAYAIQHLVSVELLNVKGSVPNKMKKPLTHHIRKYISNHGQQVNELLFRPIGKSSDNSFKKGFRSVSGRCENIRSLFDLIHQRIPENKRVEILTNNHVHSLDAILAPWLVGTN